MKAWELLSDPNKWLQGEIAADASGRDTFAESERACRWCMVGAIQKCYGTYEKRAAALRLLEPEGVFTRDKALRIAKWNDDISRTHAEVVQRLKDADV